MDEIGFGVGGVGITGAGVGFGLGSSHSHAVTKSGRNVQSFRSTIPS